MEKLPEPKPLPIEELPELPSSRCSAISFPWMIDGNILQTHGLEITRNDGSKIEFGPADSTLLSEIGNWLVKANGIQTENKLDESDFSKWFGLLMTQDPYNENMFSSENNEGLSLTEIKCPESNGRKTLWVASISIGNYYATSNNLDRLETRKAAYLNINKAIVPLIDNLKLLGFLT